MKSNTGMKLSLVIPIYNEEASLSSLFQELSGMHDALQLLGVRLEAIAVDNSSLDASWNILQEWVETEQGFEKVAVQHPINLGMQQSLLTGLRMSSGDAIAVMQSDLQDPPELIVSMVKEWLDGASFVATRIEKRRGALVGRVGAWMFYRLMAVVSDDRVITDSSDFYLFDARLKNAVIKDSGTTPFLRSSLASVASPDVVLSYQRLDREGGTTNYNLGRRVNFALDALLRNVSGMVKKIVSLAIVVGTLSFLGLISLTIAFLFGYRSPVNGYVSTMGALLLLLSTTMFLGAVTLEILSRIYRDIPRGDLSKGSTVIRSVGDLP